MCRYCTIRVWATCPLNVENIKGKVLVLICSQLREFSDGEKPWKEIGKKNCRKLEKSADKQRKNRKGC